MLCKRMSLIGNRTNHLFVATRAQASQPPMHLPCVVHVRQSVSRVTIEGGGALLCPRSSLRTTMSGPLLLDEFCSLTRGAVPRMIVVKDSVAENGYVDGMDGR